jgi:ADP-ribosylglycohydrolase
MALCLAESLVECRGFDPEDQMRRYVRWWREGHLSSTGSCFDIGNTVSGALQRFERSAEPYSGSTDPNTAGNGSLMRLAPVPLFYARDAPEAVRRSVDSSRTTHAAREAVDACRYLGGLIVGAVNGRPKEELLAEPFEPVPGIWAAEPLASKVAAIAHGPYKRKEPPEVRGTGYVVDCLEAALWAFYRSGTFREGALLAVNHENQKKHGVGFEIARLVFDDSLHLSRRDREQDGEERWVTIGTVAGVVVLIVAHTTRDEDDEEVTRIISARKATRRERRAYEEES